MSDDTKHTIPPATDDELLRQGYTHQVKIQLPTGETVVGRPLGFEDALDLLDTMDEATGGDIRAIRKVLKEFPEKTGLEGKLSKLTIGEVFQVVRYFFVYRRATKNGSKETATTWDEIVVASLSQTLSQTTPPSTDSPADASPGPSS